MRRSGILLPVSSLPSRWGIGAFDKSAYEFIDRLARANQSVWQILPLGQTGYGDSPYQSFSAYAGNPYFVSLDALIDEGLLCEDELQEFDWGSDPERVDYGLLYHNRYIVLRRAFERASQELLSATSKFALKHADWLPDYALYMALKSNFGLRSWNEWPDEGIKLRKPDSVRHYRAELEQEIHFNYFIQYLFFTQWSELKSYANSKGIRIFGDIPIYVSLDSADVWAHRELFLLDEDGIPTCVAGVPPDVFTQDGQLWGNPIYDYDRMERDSFSWWISRLRAAKGLYDIARIDHFRGLDSYWSVPYGETTAQNGSWAIGPGKRFVAAIKVAVPDMDIVAEDLGYLTDSVRELLRFSEYPGMKILQFAFGPEGDSEYLPHCYTQNCVCYTGTHDNEPVAAWLELANDATVSFAMRYLDCSKEEIPHRMLRAGMASVADLFVAQMQDYLDLGAEARTNTPSTSEGNWAWRMKADAFSDELICHIAELTRTYGR